MKKRLYDLLCGSRPPSLDDCNSEEKQRIHSNLSKLREGLDTEQNRLLLFILDDMGLLSERTAIEQYEKGFRTASRIMVRCLYPEQC